jgi:hypothetical protein
MLYFPGLKNVVADFFSPPSQPVGEVASSVATTTIDFEAMAVK